MGYKLDVKSSATAKSGIQGGVNINNGAVSGGQGLSIIALAAIAVVVLLILVLRK